MAQNYRWKVVWKFKDYNRAPMFWEKGSKIFNSKISAMNFATYVENRSDCCDVCLFKWK